MAQRNRLVGAGVLIATGLVWVAQGTGLIRGSSFMTGDPFWAWLGGAAVVSGLVIGWLSRRPVRGG